MKAVERRRLQHRAGFSCIAKLGPTKGTSPAEERAGETVMFRLRCAARATSAPGKLCRLQKTVAFVRLQVNPKIMLTDDTADPDSNVRFAQGDRACTKDDVPIDYPWGIG